jgi:hypothetical protein
MAYFGGLGAGKGWLTFLFLVETEVLRDVLAAVNPVLVVTNGRVPADYQSTSMTEYLEAYARYLNAMLESPEAASRASTAIYVGLAASLDKFSSQLCPDTKYKLMDTQEPVVNLGPETLHYDARRGQLCTNVMSKLYFGAELSFPRVISLDRDRHEVLHDTTEFPTFGIFLSMKSRLQRVTRPCRIRSPSREHRTPIRITDEMRQRMKQHPGLKEANLQIA